MALTITSSQADAEDLAQDTLLRAYRAIDRFDGRYPRAWLMTDLSYSEAAAVMGVPVGTVMSRLSRARARVRKALKFSPLTLGDLS